MNNASTRFLLTVIAMLFVNMACAQSVYFINQSNHVVQVIIQGMLADGSSVYPLSKDSKKVQKLPFQTPDAMICNIVMESASGVWGTASGKYYLLKLNDTVVLSSKAGLLSLKHISSVKRTAELVMAEELMEGVSVKPVYSLDIKKLIALESKTSTIARRDNRIDSTSIPMVKYIEQYSAAKQIDLESAQLYRYNFIGMRYYWKLKGLRGTNVIRNEKIDAFYKDSVAKWATEFTCNICSGVPYYNTAAKLTFDLLYKGYTPTAYLNAIADRSKGNTRDFLLSAYLNDRIKDQKSGLAQLMTLYDKLCESPVYKKEVSNNYLLAKAGTPANKVGLAMLMTGDKKQIDFNDMLLAYKGKVIYIDLWASWCQPCLAEMPFSLKLHEKIKEKGIKMVYISTDHDFGSWTGMAKTQQLDKDNSYILMNSGKDGLSKTLNLKSIPRYLIVGKDGKLINTDASRPSELKTYDLLIRLAGK